MNGRGGRGRRENENGKQEWRRGATEATVGAQCLGSAWRPRETAAWSNGIWYCPTTATSHHTSHITSFQSTASAIVRRRRSTAELPLLRLEKKNSGSRKKRACLFGHHIENIVHLCSFSLFFPVSLTFDLSSQDDPTCALLCNCFKQNNVRFYSVSSSTAGRKDARHQKLRESQCQCFHCHCRMHNPRR